MTNTSIFQLQLKGGYDPLIYRLRLEGSCHSLVFWFQLEGGYDLLSLPHPATLIRRRLSNLWTCHTPNSAIDNLCTLITIKSSLQLILSHHLSAHTVISNINTAGQAAHQHCWLLSSHQTSRSEHVIIKIYSSHHHHTVHHQGDCFINKVCETSVS